jgi:metal-responsive CopG/Arc/MetJ family transcriptional regulator
MWNPIHFGLQVMNTIQMTIEPNLLKVVDKLTRLRKTTRSALIRAALEAQLRREPKW